MTTTSFRVGLAQLAPRLGDARANLKQHLEWIDRAREQRIDLLIFPELSLTGYFVKDLVPALAAEPNPSDPLFGPLLHASRDLDVVVGFIEQDRRYHYYISAAYLAGERVIHIHRKVYLPTYRLFDDARFFAAGNGFNAFDTRFGRIGLAICEDFWHVSTPYLLWQDGADLLIDIAASPGYGVASDAPGHLASEATASAFLHCYSELLTDFVFYVNRVGIEDGISFWGGSTALGPNGRVLSSGPLLEEMLAVAEVNLDDLRRARLRLPTLRDERLHLVRDELARIHARRQLVGGTTPPEG